MTPSPPPSAPCPPPSPQFDILLAFDGVAIANDGTVPFRSGERISFSYLVSQVGHATAAAAVAIARR